MTGTSGSFPETARASAARLEQALLMLWARLQSRMALTEDDLRQGLTRSQWKQFQVEVSDLLTDARPVSESTLDEYFRLLKIADGMRNKLLPKRPKRRTYAWHISRAEMGVAYANAAAELTRVIFEHPNVKVMLSPISQFHEIDGWIKLNLCGGSMPILKRHMTGHREEPVQSTRQWQSAAYEFVSELMRKKYPMAWIFQEGAIP